MSIAEVQSRISELQGLLGSSGAAPPTTPTSDVAGRQFAAKLAAANAAYGGQASYLQQQSLLSRAGGAVATSRTASSSATGSTVTGSTVTGSTVTGENIVAEARKYLGVPYVRGGNSPSQGLDCSGLTELVYSKFGIDLKSVSWEQAKQGTPVSSVKDAKAGDLLFFGHPVHHVAIYAGDGKMIHAPRPGKRVEVSSVYETPSAIRRVIASPGPAGVASTSATNTVSGSWEHRPYASLFRAAGAKYGISPALLSAVAKNESAYRPDAVSGAGARGLMQLMPATARGLGVDPMNPSQAVDGAARMLRDLLKQFGSTPLALAAYNAGPGAVRKYGGIPPYKETQNYVRKVMATYQGDS